MDFAGPEQVLSLYRERINLHDFDLIAPLIDRGAVFWFSDGSHVGIEAVRAAFEATWQALRDETYWLDDVVWLMGNGDAAGCIYRFDWRATLNGAPATGVGRGTSFFRRFPDGWKIVHEHLSGMP